MTTSKRTDDDDRADSETPSFQPPELNRPVLIHRVVQCGLLLTLIWKWQYFVQASRIYGGIPLVDDFFPVWLQSAWTIRVAFLTSVGATALNFVTASRRTQKTCAWLTFLGTTLLCVHQGSYNDMTFVTAWWTALWSLWYVRRMEDEAEDEMIRRAAFLSRIIISVILLGGAVGKWTPEYWSGEVFYDIYFRDRDYWVFNLLRSTFDTDSLVEMSKWYSRKVVALETLAGFLLWMLPPRWAAAAGVIILSSIALLSNFLLFSVLSCLIGLAAVGFFVAKPNTTATPIGR